MTQLGKYFTRYEGQKTAKEKIKYGLVLYSASVALNTVTFSGVWINSRLIEKDLLRSSGYEYSRMYKEIVTDNLFSRSEIMEIATNPFYIPIKLNLNTELVENYVNSGNSVKMLKPRTKQKQQRFIGNV